MDKELEDIRQIKHMLENIDDGLEFEDDTEIRELYLKQKHALETALNYIENSIPTSAVEEKIEKLNKEYTEILSDYGNIDTDVTFDIPNENVRKHLNELITKIITLQEILQDNKKEVGRCQ